MTQRGHWVPTRRGESTAPDTPPPARRPSLRAEGGFTLVELLLVMILVPLVMGAISYGLITVFSLQNSVSGRLADSGSAQVLEATFLKDVQSAAIITENQPVWCQSPTGATQTQVLGLAWDGQGSAPVGYKDSVSYVTQQVGSSVYLIRQLCTGSSRVAGNSTTVASDLRVPPTTAPTVTCVPNTGCTKVNPLTSPVWLPAYTVSRVTFTVYETLSPVRGSATTPFEFALTGTPRTTATVTSNTITVIPPFAPLTLLSTTCPLLSTGNSSNSNITITGSGEVAVAASCNDAITLGNNSSIIGQGIETEDPNPGSTVSVKNGSAPPASTVASVTDTFTNLPTTPPSAPASQPASCSLIGGGVAICPPGYYATDPGLTPGATTLDFTGGVYTFAAGLSVGTGQTADFTQGIYTFDSSGGTALSVVNGTINGDPGGQLFYIASGAVDYGNNSVINSLAGLTTYQGVSYDGISIWDAAATGSSNAVTLSSNSSNSTYTGGGFYIPNGAINASNNFSISASFIVAQTASLNENNGVTLGP